VNDRETILDERDHALDEWSESARKCEELIDELDNALTELIVVSFSLSICVSSTRHRIL